MAGMGPEKKSFLALQTIISPQCFSKVVYTPLLKSREKFTRFQPPFLCKPFLFGPHLDHKNDLSLMIFRDYFSRLTMYSSCIPLAGRDVRSIQKDRGMQLQGVP